MRAFLLIGFHLFNQQLPVVKEFLAAAVLLLDFLGCGQNLLHAAVITLEYHCRYVLMDAVSQQSDLVLHQSFNLLT